MPPFPFFPLSIEKLKVGKYEQRFVIGHVYSDWKEILLKKI